MFPAAFEYHRPSTVQEAVALLEQSGGDAKVLAGGHSLLPLLKLRLAEPSALIDIGRLPGMSDIQLQGGDLVIGSLVTHAKVAVSDVVKQAAPLLAEAANVIGDQQVRNRGTIGGSLAHADPAGDLPAAILALDAQMKAVGPGGERTIVASEFFVDMLTSALGESEILTEIRIPALPTGAGTAYLKMDHPASHYALCGVAAIVQLDASGNVQDVRIAVTGVGSKAYRATAVEDAVRGQNASEDNVAQAAQHAADGVYALGDIHASTEYRSHLARVFTKRALNQAIARARS
ncbi:MAG: FAD binding domain-containing protein [Chloroflexota bacterium]